MNELQKAAEILVEAGYADDCKWHMNISPILFIIINHIQEGEWSERDVQPFADTLEGRRQADAIEDWLIYNAETHWKEESWRVVQGDFPSCHAFRLARIKWCLQELIK